MNKNNFPQTILPEQFPALLQLIPTKPKQLFVLGKIPDGFPIALVGTRRPSPYGKDCCRRLVASLKNTEAVVVSGLAQGIDFYSHQAALDFGVPTIAVLAQGLSAKINGERKILAEKILESGGAIISELPNDTPGFKSHYPARNRIIAGLSKATVIVESKIQGGSMITADFANQFHRPLYAVCGNYFQETAQGPLDLLRSGKAKPIYVPEDLSALCGLFSLSEKSSKESKATGLSKEAQALYKKSAGFVRTLTELATQSGLLMNSLFAILTELELAGLVSSEDGFRYFFEKEFS